MNRSDDLCPGTRDYLAARGVTGKPGDPDGGSDQHHRESVYQVNAPRGYGEAENRDALGTGSFLPPGRKSHYTITLRFYPATGG